MYFASPLSYPNHLTNIISSVIVLLTHTHLLTLLLLPLRLDKSGSLSHSFYFVLSVLIIIEDPCLHYTAVL